MVGGVGTGTGGVGSVGGGSAGAGSTTAASFFTSVHKKWQSPVSINSVLVEQSALVLVKVSCLHPVQTLFTTLLS